jgi:hypothetical protein
MVFTPHAVWPSEVTSTYPLDVLLWTLQTILPGDVVQKIVLFVILLCSGAGMHLLVRSLTAPENHTNFAWQTAAYFAGVMYMINPFTYSRFMAGQWLVLLGYALLPFVVRAFFRVVAAPSRRRTAAVAAWSFVIVTVSVHFTGMIALLAAVFLIVGGVKYRRSWVVARRLVGLMIAAAAAVIILCGYWVVPALLGGNSVGQLVTGVDDTQFAAFATSGGVLGPLGDVVRLQGFWAEARQLFVLPQTVVPLWGVVVLLLWLLIAVGMVYAWRQRREVAVVMVTCGVIGILLATTPILQGLSASLPILGGYREPHKFVALLAVAYAVLGAFGVAFVLQKWTRYRKILAAGCLALPLVITPTMFWGFGGQLAPRAYPDEWHVMNDRLKKNLTSEDSVLFLPWHMYAPFSFSDGRIIANPAEKFFQVPVVQSDDPEFEDVPPNVPNATKQSVAELLDNPNNVAATLLELNISYVLLAKEQEWTDYKFLDTGAGLQLVYEDEKLKLYKVEEQK